MGLVVRQVGPTELKLKQKPRDKTLDRPSQPSCLRVLLPWASLRPGLTSQLQGDLRPAVTSLIGPASLQRQLWPVPRCSHTFCWLGSFWSLHGKET